MGILFHLRYNSAMETVTLGLYLSLAAILFIAACVKGISGFGSSLIAIPLIGFFLLSVEDTRALVVTINFLLNVLMLRQLRSLKRETLKTFLPLIGGVLVASIISAFFLRAFLGAWFNAVLSLLLMVTALNKLFTTPWIIRSPRRYFFPVGLLGGALNTLIGAGSVPVLIFLGNTTLKKNDFKAAMVFFLLVLNTASLLSFVAADVYPVITLGWVVALVPVVFIGNTLGMRLSNRIPEKQFSLGLAVGLLTMGFWGLISSGIF